MNALRYSPLFRLARRRLSLHPALYFSAARVLGNRQLLGDDTNLVIEGFPRSANSYAEAAFAVSQAGRRLIIASHSHAAAQVIAAVKRDLVTLVLFRNPDDAVASHLEMLPARISPESLFKDYSGFYRTIMPYRDRFVLISFETCIGDFGAVVSRVNARFGTDFIVPLVDDRFVAEVNGMRDTISEGRVGRVVRYSERKPRAVLEARDARKRAIKDGLRRLEAAPARRDAIAIHDEMSALERGAGRAATSQRELRACRAGPRA